MLRDKLQRERMAKLCAKILRDEIGREELGKKMGLTIGYVPDGVPFHKVAVLVPSYKSPHPSMKEALELAARNARDVANVFFRPTRGGCVIHWVRDFMVADLYKEKADFTHVLFCDDDIVVPPDAIVKLLSHNADVIAGLCTKRVDPPLPAIQVKSKIPGKYENMLKWDMNINPLPVDGIGTGLMLISKKALDAVAEYFINCRWERKLYGEFANLEGSIKARRAFFETTGNAWWFEFLRSETMDTELGEDISFCAKAWEAGLKVYCDTSVQPAHIGEYPYKFDDFLDFQQHAASAAKADSGSIRIIE